jgi:hypothetical protein
MDPLQREALYLTRGTFVLQQKIESQMRRFTAMGFELHDQRVACPSVEHVEVRRLPGETSGPSFEDVALEEKVFLL